MRRKLSDTEVGEARLTAWMILTATNNPSLLQEPRVVLPRFWKDAEEKFELLTKRYHCDPIMLYDSLSMVEPLQKSLPEIHRQELMRFANRLEGDLEKMKNLVPSHPLQMRVEDDDPQTKKAADQAAREQAKQGTEVPIVIYRLRGSDGDLHLPKSSDDLVLAVQVPGSRNNRLVRCRKMGTGGDLHLSPRLQQSLENMIEAYRELANMKTHEKDYLKHICELLPARYVHRQTGKPHFDEIATLLDWACPLKKDAVHDPVTLRRYYREAAYCLHHLDILLYMMKKTMHKWAAFRGFRNSDKKIYSEEQRPRG